MEENVGKTGGVSKGLVVVVLVVIIVLAAGVYEFNRSKTDSAMTPSPTATESMSQPTIVMQSESLYKDGIYTVEGEYLSPGGEEQVGVVMILEDGNVVDVVFTPKATRPNSVKFQGQFANGYRERVVGKHIDEVKLDVVSGSSLTPKGFNDAVEKIKEQAKA